MEKNIKVKKTGEVLKCQILLVFWKHFSQIICVRIRESQLLHVYVDSPVWYYGNIAALLIFII